MNKCFLDLDGVIVDFCGGVLRKFSIDPATMDSLPRPLSWGWIEKITCLSEQDFWSYLDAHFWANLPWTEDGRAILAAVEARFGEDVCLLTAPGGRWEDAISGKMRWIDIHLPARYKKNVLFGSAKHYLAAESHLLVDDGEHNVRPFIECGGSAILVPRAWNSNHEEDALSYVKKWLSIY